MLEFLTFFVEKDAIVDRLGPIAKLHVFIQAYTVLLDSCCVSGWPTASPIKRLYSRLIRLYILYVCPLQTN
jgi:hypothetical protein